MNRAVQVGHELWASSVGGPLMIVLLASLFRLFLCRRLVKRACRNELEAVVRETPRLASWPSRAGARTM